MRRLSANQRKFIIERIVKGQTICECQINFKKAFKRPVSKTGVQKIMKKSNEKSVIEDLHRGRIGRPRTNLTRGNVEKVSDVLYDHGKRKSIREVSAITGLSYSGARDVLVKEIIIYPYRARVSQKLNAQQIENRLAFCLRVKKHDRKFL